MSSQEAFTRSRTDRGTQSSSRSISKMPPRMRAMHVSNLTFRSRSNWSMAFDQSDDARANQVVSSTFGRLVTTRPAVIHEIRVAPYQLIARLFVAPRLEPVPHLSTCRSACGPAPVSAERRRWTPQRTEGFAPFPLDLPFHPELRQIHCAG